MRVSCRQRRRTTKQLTLLFSRLFFFPSVFFSFFTHQARVLKDITISSVCVRMYVCVHVCMCACASCFYSLQYISSVDLFPVLELCVYVRSTADLYVFLLLLIVIIAVVESKSDGCQFVESARVQHTLTPETLHKYRC